METRRDIDLNQYGILCDFFDMFVITDSLKHALISYETLKREAIEKNDTIFLRFCERRIKDLLRIIPDVESLIKF